MAKAVSKVYGEALFKAGIDHNSISSLMEEAQELQAILQSSEELKTLLTHPQITKEEKIESVNQIFEHRLSDDMMGLIHIVIVKGRQEKLDSILEYFITLAKEYLGVGIVYVDTPVEVTSVQKKAIEERIMATTSYQSLEMHYGVDESLIGGMVIRIGDRVVDSSVRLKLSEMERNLFKVQLTSSQEG